MFFKNINDRDKHRKLGGVFLSCLLIIGNVILMDNGLQKNGDNSYAYAKESIKLSEIYKDIEINGKKISLPLKVKEFQSLGFLMGKASVGKTVNGNSFDTVSNFYQDGNKITTLIMNDKDKDLPIKEAFIYYIKIENITGKDKTIGKNNLNFKFKNNINGRTSKEEIIKGMGKPVDEKNIGGENKLYYAKSSSQVIITFNLDGKMDVFEMEFDGSLNETIDEVSSNTSNTSNTVVSNTSATQRSNTVNTTNNSSSNSDKVISNIYLRSSNTSIPYENKINIMDNQSTSSNSSSGSNTEQDYIYNSSLFSFEVEIDGNLLSLPNPYVKFKELGWEINLEEGQVMLKKDEYTLITSLKKGNKGIDVKIANFNASEEIKTEEGMVMDISVPIQSYDRGDKEFISVKFPEGINESSKLNEVVKTYGEPTMKKETDKIILIQYRKSFQQYVEFVFDAREKNMILVHLKNFAVERDN